MCIYILSCLQKFRLITLPFQNIFIRLYPIIAIADYTLLLVLEMCKNGRLPALRTPIGSRNVERQGTFQQKKTLTTGTHDASLPCY